MAYRKRLRDISSDREAQQIDLRKSERPDEIGGVQTVVTGGGWFAALAATPLIVTDCP